MDAHDVLDPSLGKPPAIASRSALLRRALPEVHADDDLMQRLTQAFEEVLDPLFAALDGLAPTYDPALADWQILDVLAGWLGFEIDERLPLEVRRRFVSRLPQLAGQQGTRSGLELALNLRFPDLPLRVIDPGRVVFSVHGEDLPPSSPGPVVVYCDVPVEQAVAAELARVIESFRPAPALPTGCGSRRRRRLTALQIRCRRLRKGRTGMPASDKKAHVPISCALKIGGAEAAVFFKEATASTTPRARSRRPSARCRTGAPT